MFMSDKVPTILWTTDDVRVEMRAAYDATVIFVRDGIKHRVFHYLPGQTWEGKGVFMEGSVDVIDDPDLISKLDARKIRRKISTIVGVKQ
jgi:hypothetical protein